MPEDTIYVGFECPLELNRRIESEAKANGGCSKSAVIRAKLVQVFFPFGLDKNPTTATPSTVPPEPREEKEAGR